MGQKWTISLILAFLLMHPIMTANATETDITRLCSVFERLMSLPSMQSRKHLETLFDEIEVICQKQSGLSVDEQGMNPSFPITLPSPRSPRRVPFCPNDTVPQNKVCGDAVPMSCTWYCLENGGWELYPKR